MPQVARKRGRALDADCVVAERERLKVGSAALARGEHTKELPHPLIADRAPVQDKRTQAGRRGERVGVRGEL